MCRRAFGKVNILKNNTNNIASEMKIKFLEQCVVTAKTYVLKYNNNNSILQSSTQKPNNFAI